jgi:hypothetical protein
MMPHRSIVSVEWSRSRSPPLSSPRTQPISIAWRAKRRREHRHRHSRKRASTVMRWHGRPALQRVGVCTRTLRVLLPVHSVELIGHCPYSSFSDFIVKPRALESGTRLADWRLETTRTDGWTPMQTRYSMPVARGRRMASAHPGRTLLALKPPANLKFRPRCCSSDSHGAPTLCPAAGGRAHIGVEHLIRRDTERTYGP